MDNQFEMIGKRISKRRTELHIKQHELAESLQISNNHLSAIECGRERPSLEAIFNICRELKVTPDYLLLGNMYANDVPQNIMDGLRLCSPMDQQLVRGVTELLIERNCTGNQTKPDMSVRIQQ